MQRKETQMDNSKSSAAEAAPVQSEKPTTGRRGGRRAESRRRLLDAARELFVERGYHATRPQDITKTAGLGHGTFYIHFKDKRECFLAFVDEAQTMLMDHINDARIEGDDERPLDVGLKELLMRIVEFETDHPGLLQAVMSDPAIIAAGEAPEQTIVDIWAREWAQGYIEQAEKGIARKDIDPLLLGALTVGAIQSTTYYVRRNNVPPEQAVDQLVRFMVSAIGAQT